MMPNVGEAFAVGRPFEVPSEAGVFVNLVNPASLLSVGAHGPNLAVITDRTRVGCKGDQRTATRDGSRRGIVTNFAQRSSDQRDRPNARRLSGHGCGGNEPCTVAHPVGNDIPTHLHPAETYRLGNILGFAGFDDLNVDALRIGEGYVLSVGRNRSAGYGILAGIGGELNLLQLG